MLRMDNWLVCICGSWMVALDLPGLPCRLNLLQMRGLLEASDARWWYTACHADKHCKHIRRPFRQKERCQHNLDWRSEKSCRELQPPTVQ